MLNPQRRDLNVGILDTEPVPLDPNRAMLDTIANVKLEIERLLNENHIKQLVRVVMNESSVVNPVIEEPTTARARTSRVPAPRAPAPLFTVPKVTSIDTLWSLWCGTYHQSLAPLKDGIGVSRPSINERSNYSKRKTICKAIESTPGATDDDKLEAFKVKYSSLYGPTAKNGLKQKDILSILQREAAAGNGDTRVGDRAAARTTDTTPIGPRYTIVNHSPTRTSRPHRSNSRSNSRSPVQRTRRIRLTFTGQQMPAEYLNQFQ
jgi:hypothetical protein